MERLNLGFDQWFLEQKRECRNPECVAARVMEVNRDSYIIRNDLGEVFAELTGNLLYTLDSSMDFPTVGDWVYAQFHNDNSFATIHGLFPRKSFLRRKISGRKIDYQLIAANIDVAFIIQSCDFDFNVRRLERYLVMVYEGRIEPVILLTKTDLVSSESMEQRMADIREAKINCKVLTVSNKTGLGMDQVREFLAPGMTYCLLGSSGVGKTSLLNHLLGQEVFETKTVREHDGKGRHSTTRRQLSLLDQGAMIIDTPGMRELGNIGVESGLDSSFSDIMELAGGCRFANCTHTREAGCSILAALENGELSEERFRSYVKLLKESEFNEMSYVDKRQKDKSFGKFIKTALKQLKKN